jgi:hypothetical protein
MNIIEAKWEEINDLWMTLERFTDAPPVVASSAVVETYRELRVSVEPIVATLRDNLATAIRAQDFLDETELNDATLETHKAAGKVVTLWKDGADKLLDTSFPLAIQALDVGMGAVDIANKAKADVQNALNATIFGLLKSPAFWIVAGIAGIIMFRQPLAALLTATINRRAKANLGGARWKRRRIS